MAQSLPYRIGFWSSLLSAMLGVVLIITNIGIGITGQWPAWEGVQSYAAWFRSLRLNYFTVAFITSFLMVILFLKIMAALYSLAPPEKKILGMLGLSFTVVCATLASITYYTQLSIVPNSIASETVEELTRFIYHAPNSVVFAVDILGFFFLGIATLCTAPLFASERVERTIRWLFIAFGIENIVGLSAHALDKQMMLLFYNLLMTVTIVAASTCLSIYFQRGKP